MTQRNLQNHLLFFLLLLFHFYFNFSSVIFSSLQSFASLSLANAVLFVFGSASPKTLTWWVRVGDVFILAMKIIVILILLPPQWISEQTISHFTIHVFISLCSVRSVAGWIVVRLCKQRFIHIGCWWLSTPRLNILPFFLFFFFSFFCSLSLSISPSPCGMVLF